jgi:hypothetical protein
VEQDAQTEATDLPDGASGIFVARGVKWLNSFEPAAENRHCAQAGFGDVLAALRPIATAMVCRGIRGVLIRPWTKRQ